jgi:GDP-L-fucose synthase
MLGRHLMLLLEELGHSNIVEHRGDLLDRASTLTWFETVQPDYVFHLAARVYGIAGNMQNQSKAYLENTLINTHVIEGCERAKVKKVVAAGTVAVYPPSVLPLCENSMWDVLPDKSETGYAMAKRGMALHLQCSDLDYCYAILTNLYGPHDRFNTETGHVIPSLVRKFYEAKMRDGFPKVWGHPKTGRDFLYVKDAVRMLVKCMEELSGPVNVAAGQTIPITGVISCLAALSHVGQYFLDDTKPVGQSWRSYDVSKLNMKPEYTLEQGLAETWDWYVKNEATVRKL